MEHVINSYSVLIGGLHPALWLGVFALCLVGELVGFSVPYLLETTWLLAGSLIGAHQMSVLVLLPMIAAATVGRIVGMSLFYHLAGFGSVRFFHRFPALK